MSELLAVTLHNDASPVVGAVNRGRDRRILCLWTRVKFHGVAPVFIPHSKELEHGLNPLQFNGRLPRGPEPQPPGPLVKALQQVQPLEAKVEVTVQIEPKGEIRRLARPVLALLDGCLKQALTLLVALG